MLPLRRIAFGPCALALAWAPARADEAETSSRDLVLEMGHADFRRPCTGCHGEGGRGDGPVAASVPPDDHHAHTIQVLTLRLAEHRGSK